MPSIVKEITETEFDALAKKLSTKPRTAAAMLRAAKPGQCLCFYPARAESAMSGAVCVRISQTHCRAVYSDGTEEIHKLNPGDLESLSERSSFFSVLSLVQSKR